MIEQSADRIVAVKNVTSSEEYLADHFPTFPVLPGVMMLETLVQAGRLLLCGGLEPHHGDDVPLVMARARNVRYGNMVRPGETLEVEVTLKSKKNGQWNLVGIGRVQGAVAVQGKFDLAPLPVKKEI